MSQLIKYEAACRALAECKSVDEAKAWSDKAAALQAYGRMAKDRTLEVDAAEIRIRAERRLGEMLALQKSSGGMSKGAAGNPGGQGAQLVRSSETTAQTATLSDAGISKDLSSRAQKLAAVPPAEFEAELAAKRERDKEDGARVTARLEKVGERELKKTAPTRAEDHSSDDDEPNAADMLDSMQRELRQAQTQVADWEKAMQGDDSTAELAKALRRIEHAERRQRELMEDAAAQKRRADFYERQLARCGKAIGQRDLDKVAAAVESMVRAQKVAA